MVTRDNIDAQLKRLGVTVKAWGAAEANELTNILTDHEQITAYVHGWYENGFATLLTTTERLLLVDKKVFHLTIEDIRYDMIAEVDFSARMMDATVRINTVNKCLRFTSMRQRRLRQLTSYVQQRVMDLRQPQRQQFNWPQFEPFPMTSQAFSRSAGQFVFNPQAEAAAAGGLPIQAPQLTPMRQLTPANHFHRPSLTTRQNFLPRVPRRRFHLS